MPVRTGPGHTQFTVMPVRPSSTASDLVSPMTACLLAVYGAERGLGVWAEATDRPWQTLVFFSLTTLQLGIAAGLRPRLVTREGPWLPLALVGSFLLALAGIYLPTSTRFVGIVMGFGSGVLISALAFELTGEAYDKAGGAAVVAGLLAGSLVFFAGDWLVDRRGGNRRKSPTGKQAGAGAAALVLGALLDGIPESVVIGVSLLEGKGVSLVAVVAIFLSNLPEGLSSAAGMRRAGRTPLYVFGIWISIALVSGLAAALGYATFAGASPALVAAVTAVAAGAILAMLTDTMIPEAFADAHDFSGLLAVAGFLTAFGLSKLGP